MKISFLNFEFGMAATRGYWQTLGYWRYLGYPKAIKKVSDFIKAQNIDVAGFAEINFPSQAEIFERETGMHAAGKEIYQNPLIRMIRQGNLLLSRYPMENWSMVPLPGDGQPRSVVRADLNTPSGKVTFLTAHLSLSERSRKIQIDFLSNLCLGINNPFVLMGDFNIRDWKEELKPLLQDDDFQHADVGPTYPSWNPKREFDHIFLSRDFKLKTAESRREDLFSDHLALVAEIT
jgi:endonuclease/exonuclease/phosphatase family metal-dependent hydrolase